MCCSGFHLKACRKPRRAETGNGNPTSRATVSMRFQPGCQTQSVLVGHHLGFRDMALGTCAMPASQLKTASLFRLYRLLYGQTRTNSAICVDDIYPPPPKPNKKSVCPPPQKKKQEEETQQQQQQTPKNSFWHDAPTQTARRRRRSTASCASQTTWSDWWRTRGIGKRRTKTRSRRSRPSSTARMSIFCLVPYMGVSFLGQIVLFVWFPTWIWVKTNHRCPFWLVCFQYRGVFLV